MSTTIAHPRSVPSGPSGKVVAGLAAAAIMVLGVGYGIVNLAEPESVAVSPQSAQGADRVFTERGADLAAQQAAARAAGERMLGINELGYSQSTARGADQLVLQKAAEFASQQAALAETQRLIGVNENWASFSSPSTDGGSRWQPHVE